MKQYNTIGVDLAKYIIQVSVMDANGNEIVNRSYSRTKFVEFLSQQPPGLVAFETCSSSHHWAHKAKGFGHRIKILPAKSIIAYRQGHKTGVNDALAIAKAATRPQILEAPLKSIEQQGLQAIQRSRELLVQERTALSNHLRGLLMEFGLVIPTGFSSLHQRIPGILEDGENELPDLYRPTLQHMYARLLQLRDDIQILEHIRVCVKQHRVCERSVLYYCLRPWAQGEVFKNGRQFAAYVGLTPKQYSSGGKTNLDGISKKVANKRLRAVLIQGARAYVHKLKEPKTHKDRWLLSVIERSGYGKAAVALVNKNVRTAWALLTTGEDYQPQPLPLAA